MRIVCKSCGKSYNTDKDELCPNCGSYNQFDRDEQKGSSSWSANTNTYDQEQDNERYYKEKYKGNYDNDTNERKIHFDRSSKSRKYQRNQNDTYSNNEPTQEKKGSCLLFLIKSFVVLLVLIPLLSKGSEVAVDVISKTLSEELQYVEEETYQLNQPFTLENGATFRIKGYERIPLSQEIIGKIEEEKDVKIDKMEALLVKMDATRGDGPKSAEIYLRGEEMIYMPFVSWEIEKEILKGKEIEIWSKYYYDDREYGVLFLVPQAEEGKPKPQLSLCVQQNKDLSFVHIKRTEKKITVNLTEVGE